MSFDIETKRKEKRLTLEELAKMVGVSKSTVKKWESGYIKNMRRDKILSLATALEVSPMDIILSDEAHSPHVVEVISPPKEILSNYQSFARNIFSKKIPENFGIFFSKDKLYLVDTTRIKSK